MILLLALLLLQEPPASTSAALKPYVERRELAGAVALVASKDKILSLEAVGFQDVAASIPLKTDAVFWIASQSKPITAAAVMMLVDEGKIALDDPVEKHLPEFKGQMVAVERDADHVLLRKPARPPTIRDCLNHTSGMKFSSPMEKPTLDGLSLKDAARSYAMMPLESEPGAKYQYSNAGINTAARILEVVAGVSYEAFMHDRLFAPLGMKDTTFWPDEGQLARLAKPYKPNAAKDGLEETTISQLTYPLHQPHRQPMPAGGLFSTASDCARFLRMVLHGGELEGRRYLSEAAVKEMTKRQTPEALKDSYGLGWSVGADGYGHGGALATDMRVDAKRGLVLVYLVQHAGFAGEGKNAQGAFRKTAERLFGGP
ncbi:MAG TPA: serine hydrolase domain-containing protein [Planctomycetota bacterium]